MIFYYIISVIIYLALIFVTINIAGKKNRSQLGFGIFAVFLPLIALIVVLIIGPSKPEGVVAVEEKIE